MPDRRFGLRVGAGDRRDRRGSRRAGALVFAYLTVRGAQAFRRHESRTHLLDLAADVTEVGLRALTDSAEYHRARIARYRFRAAIDATGELLPACRALAEIEWFPPMAMGDSHRIDEVDAALEAALDELAAWLRD